MTVIVIVLLVRSGLVSVSVLLLFTRSYFELIFRRAHNFNSFRIIIEATGDAQI